MSGNSRLLVVESVLRQGNEPGMGKLMDMNMLVIHGGLERTEAEYAKLLRQSGFVLAKTEVTGSVVDGSRPSWHERPLLCLEGVETTYAAFSLQLPAELMFSRNAEAWSSLSGQATDPIW